MGVAVAIDDGLEPLVSGTWGSTPPAIYHQLDEKEALLYSSSLLRKASGGTWPVLPIEQLSGAPLLAVDRELEPAAESNPISSAIETICSSFDLTKDDLSKLLEIRSRKTLYNWINGDSVPKRESLDRIYSLLLVARSWEKSGLRLDKGQMKLPALRGRSVLDLLADPAASEEDILFAGSRVNLLTALEALADPFA